MLEIGIIFCGLLIVGILFYPRKPAYRSSKRPLSTQSYWQDKQGY